MERTQLAFSTAVASVAVAAAVGWVTIFVSAVVVAVAAAVGETTSAVVVETTAAPLLAVVTILWTAARLRTGSTRLLLSLEANGVHIRLFLVFTERGGEVVGRGVVEGWRICS